ncbi:MAG: ATP-dependent DNA helicase [Rothia sp. (in: high G+C Gram-positive bacteria)]|uniref:ATP-dependent DNA helicase n=1 Tax=Rothia sp. (in: high G+C Gram-positive bacteria) TaxID=1885016 RepID=UPI0026E0137D|nr:ATP-dependent DNA helicase [Rothia sp. (in: high G+C Gram-positive bacteria)]MDO5751073.1 ATP-dependent DNA helicase [Rothia sp. (in: high G+C Gram-positive bacteria)]
MENHVENTENMNAIQGNVAQENRPQSTPRFSAVELADILELNRPTPEQIAMIEADMSSHLVIAGAGSGKTATMVDRVIYLVANGFVRPQEILGVTFTRKAAGELRERMRARLAILRAKGYMPEATEEELIAGDSDPVISTYHSYANTLVKDYGLRLGYEQDAQLLGDAQKYQLAAQIVSYWDGELPRNKKDEFQAKSTIIAAMLTLSDQCAEHLQSPEQVREFCARQLEAYTETFEESKGSRAEYREITLHLKNTIALSYVVERYALIKKRMQVMDYGDLMVLASRIARQFPQVARAERERYKVVLLDEFQDTSHTQMCLFSDLFGSGSRAAHSTSHGTGASESLPEHPVMAVGDPKQSIYGFRGASSGQLFSFYDYFHSADPTPLYLSVAWRNDKAILDAANHLAEPLKHAPEWVRGSVPSTVPDLQLRAVITQPDPAGLEAMRGRVELARYGTAAAEAQALAERIAAERARTAPGQEHPTMAVLTRTRAQLEPIAQALTALNIPSQLGGIGGLIDKPEIIDMVATLQILADPSRSDALARLLTGPRWRIGTADMIALGEYSNELARTRGMALPENPEAMEEISDFGSLIEAIENLPEPGHVTGKNGRSMSPEALARLQEFREELYTLRTMLTEDLGTLLYEIERVLMLDIELAVRSGDSYASRANLDAFHDVAARYAQSSPRINATIYAGADGTSEDEEKATQRFVLSAGGVNYLMGFLAWIEETARSEKGLAPAIEQARPGTVQLLTMHGSKGLEWDNVYLPGLADRANTSVKTWQYGPLGELPWPLRGDKNYMPSQLESLQEIRELESLKELKETLTLANEQCEEYQLEEERRLMYVAATRARSLLVASCARWRGANATPLVADPFWNELVHFATGEPLPGGAEDTQSASPEPENYPHYMGTGVVNYAWDQDPKKKPRAIDIDAYFGSRLEDEGQDYAALARELVAQAPVPAPVPYAQASSLQEALSWQVRPVIAQRLIDPVAWTSYNPDQGSVLTAMWPFDPFEGPSVYRWESEKALAAGMLLALRHGVALPPGRVPANSAAERADERARAARAQELFGVSGVSGTVNVAAGENPELNTVQEPGWFASLPTRKERTLAAARMLLSYPGVLIEHEQLTPAQQAQAKDWAQEADMLLKLARREVGVTLPAKPEAFSASTLIELNENAAAMRAQLMRPVPRKPSRAARTGTLFHEWVEGHYNSAPMLDIDEELYEDDDSDFSSTIEELRESFLASQWAHRTMWAAEYPVETHLAGTSIRGRIDAVFRTETVDEQGNPLTLWELVDWKTGRVPSKSAMRSKRIQLAVYKIAFARVMGVDPDTIRTAFHYVGPNTTIWDSDIQGGIPSASELERLITKHKWSESNTEE